VRRPDNPKTGWSVYIKIPGGRFDDDGGIFDRGRDGGVGNVSVFCCLFAGFCFSSVTKSTGKVMLGRWVARGGGGHRVRRTVRETYVAGVGPDERTAAESCRRSNTRDYKSVFGYGKRGFSCSVEKPENFLRADNIFPHRAYVTQACFSFYSQLYRP